jgi:hypothetical protein
MPPLILSVGIAEPPRARRAVYGRRIVARFVVRRHPLAQAFQVLALVFRFSYRHDTPPPAILDSLVSLQELA